MNKPLTTTNFDMDSVWLGENRSNVLVRHAMLRDKIQLQIWTERKGPNGIITEEKVLNSSLKQALVWIFAVDLQGGYEIH